MYFSIWFSSLKSSKGIAEIALEYDTQMPICLQLNKLWNCHVPNDHTVNSAEYDIPFHVQMLESRKIREPPL